MQNTSIEKSYEPGLRPPQSKKNTVVELLEKRGKTPAEISDILSWDLKQLPDLLSLKDLPLASARLIQAMEAQETIGIYGDYDVDGTTSCALFFHFFKLLNYHQIKLIQPSRFDEGYGLHKSSIDQAIEKNIAVLVTVDCGITNCEAAHYAKELGVDLIITDHHQDGAPQMPEAYAIVNPNRRDEPEDQVLRKLAGVGVAFCVGLQIKKDLEQKGQKVPSLYQLLEFVAVGTISDLAELTPVNLKLVRHGLKQMPRSSFAGIRSFLSAEERLAPFTSSEKISFNIGPLINSKGRLDHPERALNLLTTSDPTQAFEEYSHLEVCNKKRKEIQNIVFSEAKEQVLSSIKGQELLLNMVYAPKWHEGVIGIVASKLVETFKVPAIVCADAEEKGVIKASARSAGELSIFEALKNCSQYFIKFGGHKAAAGLSFKAENFDLIAQSLNAYLGEIAPIERTVQDHFDLEIDPSQITPQLVKELETLEPFGRGNEKPIFKMQDIRLDSYKILKDLHVKWNFSAKDDPSVKLQGISFFYIKKWGALGPEELFTGQNEQNLTLFFTLGINRFRGNEYIQLLINNLELN